MNELLEPFARMLDEIASPAAVRALEAGGSAKAIWAELAASGFLDALVGEAHGGAGLTLGDIEPLVEAIGAHALPLPLAETMVARASLPQRAFPRPMHRSRWRPPSLCRYPARCWPRMCWSTMAKL